MIWNLLIFGSFSLCLNYICSIRNNDISHSNIMYNYHNNLNSNSLYFYCKIKKKSFLFQIIKFSLNNSNWVTVRAFGVYSSTMRTVYSITVFSQNMHVKIFAHFHFETKNSGNKSEVWMHGISKDFMVFPFYSC